MTIARRLGLAVLLACGTVDLSADDRIFPQTENPFFVAQVTGVNGSTIQGTCAAFVPPTLSRLHIKCTNIQGGRTPVGVQLTELDSLFGERGLVNATFSGGATFNHDITNVESRVTSNLLSGGLGIRFNSTAGPEGLGRFVAADEVRTLFPMAPVQGGQDRLGICQAATITSPPLLGLFCEHNISSPTSFVFHQGTVSNRSGELFRLSFGGNSGNDVISGIVDANDTLIRYVNSESTNVNIFNATNSIAGNNMPCHPGPAALCLNGNRFRVQIDWQNSQGQSGVGRPAASSDEAGLFYFFNSSSMEAMVKVVNGCTLSNRYWVFMGAATNVQYRLEVTDTFSGRSKTYTNPLGTPAPAIVDTDAFATCP